MGDDEFIDCAQEGLQIHILPCVTLNPPLLSPSHTDLYRNASDSPTLLPLARCLLRLLTIRLAETKNTWHRPDPSFTYLLAFFMFLTGIAWGIASTTSIAATVRLTLLFVFVHFLAVSLLVATAAFFLVGRLLGPGIAGLPGRRRRPGLFTEAEEGEQLEFGYCFDVSGANPDLELWKGAQDADTRGTGCDSGFFPDVGLVVCGTIYLGTLDHK